MLLMPIIAQGNQDSQLILNKSIIKNLQLSTFMRCSSGEVRIIPVNNNFNDYLLIINKLDTACLAEENSKLSLLLFEKNYQDRQKEVSLNPENTNFNFDFSSYKTKKGKTVYEKTTIKSPVNLTCVEQCNYNQESLVKFDNNYYYLSFENDFGIEAELIGSNLLLFKAFWASRTSNIIFDTALNQLIVLPSGEIEFLDKTFVAKETKSYFKEGGAFWYNSVRDYNGKIIEFLDMESDDCFTKDAFFENFVEELSATGRDKLCVLR